MDGRFRLPVGPRTAAILLMIAGAAGFVIARLLFGDQVLCLVVSTLLTFAGLGIIIAGRRYGWKTGRGQDGGTSGGPPDGYIEPEDRPGKQKVFKVPAPNQNPFRQEGLPLRDRPRQVPVETLFPLAERVVLILRQQGALVSVDTVRDERCILNIETDDGEEFLAIVVESVDPVDVNDLRALYAMVQSGQFSGGYIISAGAFTQRALDWAHGKPLRLVDEGDIHNLYA